MLQDIEQKILRVIVTKYRGIHRAVESNKIANELNEDHDYVKDVLNILEEENYVRLEKGTGGYVAAFPEPKANLTIEHPEYMEKKFNGAILLDVLSDAIEKSEDIPQGNKKTLIDKIRELKDDPYTTTIGGGLILEAIKKYIGL